MYRTPSCPEEFSTIVISPKYIGCASPKQLNLQSLPKNTHDKIQTLFATISSQICKTYSPDNRFSPDYTTLTFVHYTILT